MNVLVCFCAVLALWAACARACPAPDPAVLAREHGLGAVPLDIPAAEIAAQARASAGDVCFAEAFGAALSRVVHESDPPDPESAASLLATYGYAHLRHPDTLLWLARTREHAPRGEGAAAWWRFALVMPALSDHVHWIVVGRERGSLGRLVVESYGFN